MSNKNDSFKNNNKIKKRTEVIVPQTVAQLESDYAEQHGQVVLYLEMLSPKKSMI